MSEETLSAIDRLFNCGCYEDDPEMGICKHTSIKLESLHRAASAGRELRDSMTPYVAPSRMWYETGYKNVEAYDLATSPSENSSDDGGEVG